MEKPMNNKKNKLYPDEDIRLINSYLTTDLTESVGTETPKRGEVEEGGYVVELEEAPFGGAMIQLPQELLDKLGWWSGNTIDVTITENLLDFGEVDSIVLRNLTKEKNDD